MANENAAVAIPAPAPAMNNGAPPASPSVPATAPESGAAVPAAGGAPPTRGEITRNFANEVLSGAPTTPAAPTGGDSDLPDTPSGDEDEVSNEFSKLDKEFEGEVDEDVHALAKPAAQVKPAAQPTPATAPAATPASPAATPTAAQPTSPPQPAAAPTTPPSQPAPDLASPLEMFDLFATPPVETPAPSAPAPGTSTTQPAPTATPEAETGEQKMKRLRTDHVAKMATSYALSEDEARAVMLEPEKVLPQMMARVHADTVESVISGIANQIPGMIEMTLRQMMNRQQLNQSFYKTWPQLAKNEYAPTVRNILNYHRANNPNDPWEKVVREVGAAALITLKLPLPPELVGTVQPATSPTMPPVSPANPGGGRPAPKSASDNPFEQLNDEWDREESLPDD